MIQINNSLQATPFTFTSQEDLNTSIPLNGSDATNPNSNLTFYIASLPTQGGHLFLPSAGSSSLTPGSVVPGGKVSYQPVLYKFGSPWETFTFYVNSTSGFCSAPATVVSDCSPLSCIAG
jgi:hypothetical protein